MIHTVRGSCEIECVCNKVAWMTICLVKKRCEVSEEVLGSLTANDEIDCHHPVLKNRSLHLIWLNSSLSLPEAQEEAKTFCVRGLVKRPPDSRALNFLPTSNRDTPGGVTITVKQPCFCVMGTVRVVETDCVYYVFLMKVKLNVPKKPAPLQGHQEQGALGAGSAWESQTLNPNFAS